MTLVGLLIALAILGAIVYCIKLIPMSAPFPTVITVIACIVAVILVLQFLGVDTGLNTLRIS